MVTLLFSLFSCSEELYEETIHSSKKIKITEVEFKELFKDEKISNLLSLINHNNNVFARTEFENQLGFTISDGNVKIIEKDNITSYTMLIHRDGVTDNSYFENLVIQNDIYNNKKAAIFKYIPSNITPTGHNSFKFEGDIQKTDVAFSGGSQNATQSGCYAQGLMCCESWSSPGTSGSSHPATSQCTDINFLFVETFEVICAPNDGGFEPSGGGPVNWDPGFGNGPTPGNGGGPSDPNTPTAPQDYQVPEIITSPILDTENSDDIRNTSLFYQSLSPLQLQWVMADPNHQIIINQLIQYQIDNNWSDESKQFANEMINLNTANNSIFTIDNTITAENGLVFNDINELQDYINNINNSVASIVETEDNGNNTKTSRFKFDLGMFAYLNVSVKQKLQATGQTYSIENVSSSISGLTLALEWEQNDDDDVNISGNIATVTFTGTLSLNCFVEGIGVFFSDNVTIICTFNITTGALISSQLIGLE